VSHPVDGLDEVVHQRTRLGILAVLAEGGKVQFGLLRDALTLTDGNLSRHLAILEEAGYVAIQKGYEGKRPRTWIKITRSGRRSLAGEVAVLKAIVNRIEQPETEIGELVRTEPPIPS
jgi:DNA-binding MarR family transcriptional regulator